MPKAYIVTPNINEASLLAGLKIRTAEDVKKTCKKLYEIGPDFVLIKGGHLEGKLVQDVLFDGGKFTIFSLPRLPNKKAHGSGCTLSALITGLIANGESPKDAISKAKNILWGMMYKGYSPGKGSDVLNHSFDIENDIPPKFSTDEQVIVWMGLKTSVDDLLSFLPKECIPEVGMNIGYALPNAKKLKDVCSINGRIVKTKDKFVSCGRLDFGVSKHIASIILAAMNTDQSNRCAMNIKYSERILQECRKAGFSISSFDRTCEPKSVNSTMEWGTSEAIKKHKSVPDIIYDEGGVGKEPMIRVIGKNPKDVIDKIRALRKVYK
jgi:hydroxymethylpyrimidine/phosphomethylpyrimidine kinase